MPCGAGLSPSILKANPRYRQLECAICICLFHFHRSDLSVSDIVRSTSWTTNQKVNLIAVWWRLSIGKSRKCPHWAFLLFLGISDFLNKDFSCQESNLNGHPRPKIAWDRKIQCNSPFSNGSEVNANENETLINIVGAAAQAALPRYFCMSATCSSRCWNSPTTMRVCLVYVSPMQLPVFSTRGRPHVLCIQRQYPS